MLGVLLLLIFVTLVIYASAPHIRRVRARAWADQVITGRRQANATKLNKYIDRLTATDAWLIGRSKKDLQRIEQLRNIRDRLVAKHMIAKHS